MKKKWTTWMLVFCLLIGLLAPAAPVMAKAKTPKLNYRTVKLERKETVNLKVKNTKKAVKWSSTNKKVASVSKKGKVTAKKKGKAVIKAKVSGKTYRCKVIVTKRKLNKKSAVLTEGDTLKLALSNSFGKLKWKSSNSNVAAVNKKGKVTAKKAGKTTISVKCNKKKYTCKITVNKKPDPVGIIHIAFTNEDIKEQTASGDGGLYQSLETSEESIAITGEITCEKTTLNQLSCELRDSRNTLLAKKSLAVSDSFETVVKPGIGTNILTVTAKGIDGSVAKKDLMIVRYSKEIKVSEKLVGLTDEETSDFVSSIQNVDYQDVTETVNGNPIVHTYTTITLDSSCSLTAKLQNGTLKKGDVLSVSEAETLPAGFTGVLVKYETISDAEGPKTIVTFREAGFSDVFAGDGCMEIDGINEKDPVAFAIVPGSGRENALAGREERTGADDSEKKYERSAIPDGLATRLTPNVRLSKDKVTIGMDINNIILYDKDQVKDTNDKVVLSGSISVEDLTADAHIEWNKFLPSQIRYDESYSLRTNAKITANFPMDTFELSKIIKEANGAFENECELMGIKVNGIDMKNRFIIGLVGIRLVSKTTVSLSSGEIGNYAKTMADPILFVALYLDVDGKISGELSVAIDYSSYTEQGINLYHQGDGNIKYNGPASPTEKKELGAGFVLESYQNKRAAKDDYGVPNPVITLDGNVKGSAGLALGAMAGVMIKGIIPADCYLEAYGVTEAELDGKLKIKVGTTDEELHRLNPDIVIRGSSEVGARIGFDAKLSIDCLIPLMDDINVGVSPSYEFKFLEVKFDFPRYRLHGTTSRLVKLGSTEKELLGNAEFKFYKEKELAKPDGAYTEEFLSHYEPAVTGKSDANGTYDIRGMERESYVVLITHAGFEPHIETVNFREDVEKVFCLTPLRERNWLDVCQPVSYTGYDGKTYIGDGKGSMTISGVTYDIGFYLDGGDGGSANSYAHWELGKKYKDLEVRIGHLDDSSALTASLEVYLDGAEEPSQTIDLSPTAVSEVHTIHLDYADTAIFKMKRGTTSNWAHARYGFVEGVWHGVNGAEGTVITKDPFENADWNADFMTLCPPFATRSCDLYTENDEKAIQIGETQYASGFVLNTSGGFGSGSKYGYASFNTSGEFSSLEVTVGMTANSSRTYATTMYAYLPGVSDPVMKVDLNKDTVETISIPINYAEGLYIRLDSKADSGTGAGAAYAFVNGKWIR